MFVGGVARTFALHATWEDADPLALPSSPPPDIDVGVLPSLLGAHTDVLQIEAPPEGCWSLGLGRTERDVFEVATGCGPTSIDLQQGDQVYALITKRPADATWDLGAKLKVDGELVRQIAPAPYPALTVRHDVRLPPKTVLVRVDAPDGSCWSATMDNDGVRRGCGALAFPLEVEDSVILRFERQKPGDWHFTVAIEVDGRVVQTVGPTTAEYPSLNIAYIVPSNG